MSAFLIGVWVNLYPPSALLRAFAIAGADEIRHSSPIPLAP